MNLITTITIVKFKYDATSDSFYLDEQSETVSSTDTLELLCNGDNTVSIPVVIPYYDV